MNERILAAARSGDVDTLRDCINKGAEVNCKDVDYLGGTPLHIAAMTGQTEVAYLLLKAGASHSVMDKEGRTPLHIAAMTGQTEVADLLLKAGASHSVMDKEGETPLHTAIENSRGKVGDLLLKAGASLSEMDYLTIQLNS